MIEKMLSLSLIDTELLLFLDPGVRGVTKHAAASDLAPEIAGALSRMSSGKATDGSMYLLVVGLGAGEYWGANRNGDYFPEASLLKNYRTFGDARIYRQHQNKDPNKAIGDVILAAYNHVMHRVELIISFRKELAPDLVKKVEAGELPDVSMGTRVPFDECSICHNRARTRAEYCDHLKYRMGQILPDGRQVYAINHDPSFFDLSVVAVGAEPTAKALLKIAMLSGNLENAKTAGEKEAEIEKEVEAFPVKADSSASNLMDALYEQDSPLGEDTLDRLKNYPLSDVVGTATYMGIQLKPREMLHLAPDDLDYMSPAYLQELLTPREPVRHPGIMSLLAPWLCRRSYHYPFVVYRLGIDGVPLLKVGSLSETYGALYTTYREVLPEVFVKEAALLDMGSLFMLALLSKLGVPLLSTKQESEKLSPYDMYLQALGEQAKARATGPMAGVFFDKTAANFVGSAITGMLGGHLIGAAVRKQNLEKLERGERPSEILDALGKHPNLVGAGLTALIWPRSRKTLKTFLTFKPKK